MIANRLHWFVPVAIAKFELCGLDAKSAQIPLCSLESFEVAECKSELVLNIVGLCLLSAMAFVFARIVVFCEQAVASDHTRKVAFSVFFGFGRRLVCVPYALNEVVDSEVWSSTFSVHFACC